MKRIEFECVFDLAETMISMLDESKNIYPVISVYGKYDVIKTILEDLILCDVGIAESIELESYQIDYYDKEFVLYLAQDGVSVCKCWKYDGYLKGSGNISFVHEDCNSTILKYIDSECIYEFGIGNEINDEEYECDCCDCCQCDEESEITVTKNGDMHGFSVNQSDENGTSSYSFYSTDINLVNQMAKLFR